MEGNAARVRESDPECDDSDHIPIYLPSTLPLLPRDGYHPDGIYRLLQMRRIASNAVMDYTDLR